MGSYYTNLKLTEDLVVALLLGNSSIQKQPNGKHILHFILAENKQFILEMYLERNKINSLYIEKQDDKESNLYVLNSSLILERIINEWTELGKVIAIDPRYFNNNMFMLWVCLFGEKTKRDVVIKHNNLTYDVQIMIISLFREIMRTTSIVTNKYYFKMGSFDEFLLGSIRNNRPSYESAELETLLSNKERERLGLVKQYRKEDDINYAYHT